MARPDPLILLDIRPFDAANAEKLKRALPAVAGDDPHLTFHPGQDEREITLGALSDTQLERTVERLAREFDVAAAVGRPHVVYKGLTEPIMYVVIAGPPDCVADITKSLVQRRGLVEPPTARREEQIIRATVPLAELFGYRSHLRQVTRGRATFSQVLYEYRPIPESPPDPEVGVREPRPTAPIRRTGAISLVEPHPRPEGEPPP